MLRSLLAVAACLALLSPAFAQTAPPEPTYTEPLGIGLEGVEYPVVSRILNLTVEGQPVRLSYMDAATGLRGQLTAHMPRAVEQPVVLLLHGKNFNGYYWGGTMKALAEAGYRVIVPDQIGFGKSSKPDIDYSFDLLAATTAQLLDALKIRQVAVVGHSMGGMLAVRFARTYPERVTKLILENPIGLEDYRFFIPPQSTETLFQAELADTDPAKIRAFLKKYFVTWKPEYEKFVEFKAREALSSEWPRWAKASALTYQMIYREPVRHEFGLLDVPTLLVIGQADRTVVGRNYAPPDIASKLGNYPELGRAAARDIRGSQLVEVPNVGHIPHLEAPELFHSALLKFLKQ